MSAPKAVWSLDRETFNCDSLGELLESTGDDLEAGLTVYFGDAIKPDTGFVDADDVIDLIGTRAYDVGGEHAERFPHVSGDAWRALNDFLREWQAKHCQPTFWTVSNIKEYRLTAADVRGAA